MLERKQTMIMLLKATSAEGSRDKVNIDIIANQTGRRTCIMSGMMLVIIVRIGNHWPHLKVLLLDIYLYHFCITIKSTFVFYYSTNQQDNDNVDDDEPYQ